MMSRAHDVRRGAPRGSGPRCRMGRMKLTKKSHACIRLEKDGQTLVIDPGVFSEEDAAVGADAILVTHEHLDHFNEERLRAGMEANPGAEIWTLKSVAEQI